MTHIHRLGTRSMPESIYHIDLDGEVRVLQPADGVELGQFYRDSLQCVEFEICARHRLRHGDFELLVVGDGNARLTGAPWNRVLTDALGRTVFGDALLVCLHAVGEDGDDSRLADVCCIYDEMAKFLSMSQFSAAQYCARPLPIRVQELLKFFEDADCA